MVTRNDNIDFLRGIATFCIILIHTAFWSGELYLPAVVKNLTLLIDVPVFMFISGISFSYVNSVSKNVKSLIKQWKKWIFFVIIFALIIFIFYRTQFSFKDFFCWLVYYFPKSTPLIVVKGSIWFWVMYIKVTILCSIIICINNKYAKSKTDNVRNLINILLLITIMFIYTSISGHKEFFIDAKTLFFSIMYLLGYVATTKKIDLKKTLIYELGLVIITCCMFYVLKYGIADIQKLKFSFSVTYLPFSMLSVVLFWYLKDRLKIKSSNPINYIGKNALWFYFAQGISSSLIYYVYDFLKGRHDIVIFSIMLVLNIIMALAIAILLEKTYNLITEFFVKNLGSLFTKQK